MWALCLLFACAPRADNSLAKLPAPVESTTVGPGDVVIIEVVGEKELPREYQIDSEGAVAVPYVGSVPVGGLEPQEIARVIRERLIEKRILTDPSVIVRVEEYNSKKVTVLGQVTKAGSFPLTPGMTLLQAISLAGGFNAIANTRSINLTRKTKDGTRTVKLSVDAITDGKFPDVSLQAGDQIYVPERLF